MACRRDVLCGGGKGAGTEGSVGEPAVHDFDGVEGVDAGAVEDLLAAGGAGSGDEGGGGVAGVVVRGGDGTAQRGEEEHLADGDGGLVVFFLVAEGAGHATAAGGDDVESAAFEQAEHGCGFFDADEGFLVAVAVEPDVEGLGTELFGTDVAPGDFAHDEFVEKETVGGKTGGIVSQLGRDEVGVFVAEGEDAAGFDADKGGVVGDEVAEFEDVFASKFGSEVEASFGDGGTAAFDMVGDDDLIAEGGEESGEGEAETGFLEVGEFVGEEVYFARGLGGRFDFLDELAHGARREGGDGTFGGEGDDAFDDG